MIVIRSSHSASLPLNNWDVTESDFTLSASAVDVVVSGESSSQTTIDDRLLDVYTGAVINHEASCDATAFVSYASSDEAIATVAANGYVSRVGNGTVGIIARSKKISKRVDVAISQSGSGSTNIFNNFVEGSLARHMCDQVDDRIAGKEAGTSKAIFNVQDFSTHTYERNTDCWLGDVDHTCFSPWNSLSFHKRAGTLISPRHFVTADHYYISIGETIKFVTADNQVITRTVTGRQRIASTDIDVQLLDSDVPETIGFCKVLPSNWTDYLPSIHPTTLLAGHAVMATDFEEKALIFEWAYLRNIGTGGIVAMTTDSYQDGVKENRLPWHEAIISGDSGNPLCAIINGEMVLITTWLGISGGNAHSAYITEINSAMISLGGGYQLTIADLSGFTSYA